MTYEQTVWVDGPEGDTPIKAANLNKIEQALVQLDADLAAGGAVQSVNGATGAVVLDAAAVGAAATAHTHVPSSIGASALGHSHSPAEVGAADAVHTHSLTNLGAAATVHGHQATDITNSTPVGRSVLTAANAAAARTATGAAAASHSHGLADLTATGTRDASTFLRGDNTWAAPPAGGGGGTTVVPATIFVAASTASAAEKTLAGPTYTCDGTADDVQINAAITAIKAAGGGWVQLSAGDFNLAARVVIAGKSDENQRQHLGLRGAGDFATRLRPASGLASALHLTNCVTASVHDFAIYVSGNTTGITSAADHVNSAASHKSFWMSSFKNIEVWGDFAGTGTGWGLDLDSPFRAVFENIDVTGTRNGVRLYSSHDAFNPGNSLFLRCFMSIFGSNGFAWKLESTVSAGKLNIIEFLMCEGIAFNGTGNTAVWLGGVGPVNNTRWRSTNFEQFDTLLNVDRGEDHVMDGDYWDVRTGAAANTTTFIKFGANAWNNRVSIGNAFTRVATRLVLADAAAKPSIPNLVEHVKMIVDTGGAVTNSIATPASVVSRWITAEGVNAANASTVVVTPANEVIGTGVTAARVMTQAAYDALGTKSATTLYVIQG